MFKLNIIDAFRHLAFVNKQSRKFWLPIKSAYELSLLVKPIKIFRNNVSEKIDNFFNRNPTIKKYKDLIKKPIDYAYTFITSSRTTKAIAVISSVLLGVTSGGIVPLAVMSVSLFSIFAKTCIDAYMTFKLERKARESKLLSRYIDCKKEAIEIFKEKALKDPILETMLADNIKSQEEISKLQVIRIIKNIYQLEKEKRPGYKDAVRPLKQKLNELHRNLGDGGSKGLRAFVRANLWATVLSLGDAGILAINTALCAANPLYAASLSISTACAYIGSTFTVYNNETSLRRYQKDIDNAKTRVDVPNYSSFSELKMAVKKMELVKNHLKKMEKRPDIKTKDLVRKVHEIVIKEPFLAQTRKVLKRVIVSFNPFGRKFLTPGGEDLLIKKEVVSFNSKNRPELGKQEVQVSSKGKEALSRKEYLEVLSTSSNVTNLVKLAKLKELHANDGTAIGANIIETGISTISSLMLHKKQKNLKRGNKEGRSLRLSLDPGSKK
jgi:hypothetical protein